MGKVGLQAEGYRFVHRTHVAGGAKFDWVHPLELRASDVDCTDMDDEAFALYVAAATGAQQ